MKVLFFSIARTVTGRAEMEIALPEPASLDAVWARLIERHAGLDDLRKVSRLSCNGVYAGAETLFHDGDVAAVIPPVSGG